ncbi:MAG: hypothetical protein WC342_00185 [Methanoregula sp.]
MNYCPVCNREYKEMSGKQTLHCPVCGTALSHISDEAMARVRRETIQKKE